MAWYARWCVACLPFEVVRALTTATALHLQITEQLRGLGAPPSSPNFASLSLSSPLTTGGGATGPSAPASRADVDAVAARLRKLEAQLAATTDQAAAMDRAITALLATTESIRLQATVSAPASADAQRTTGENQASDASADLAAALEASALAVRVQQLDQALAVQVAALRQDVGVQVAEALAAAGLGAVSAACGSEDGMGSASSMAGGAGLAGGVAAGDVVTLAALDSRVQQLHTAATAMRNRLLAVQEYVDSTQVGRCAGAVELG